MKKVIFAAVLAFAIRCGCESFGATSGFEKVGDHCYYLQLKERKNVAAVVTEDGILVVDPPQEPDLSVAVDALRRISSKPVRWVVLTDPRFSRAAGTRFFAEQGSLLLASTQLRALSTTQPEETPSFPWLTFERQMHLFPSNLEIRIMAIQHKASTGGDVVAYVPAEKVLFVGDLYEAACYPDIDDASQGSALGWIDGLKQVIDSVPVLKSAIPPKPKPKQERTLEEGILVVSARGEASNLQNMKDLLEACQKLRRDISKAIRMGQSCESFLASPGADPYRGYANLAPFAAQLFEDLAAAAGPNK